MVAWLRAVSFTHLREVAGGDFSLGELGPGHSIRPCWDATWPVDVIVDARLRLGWCGENPAPRRTYAGGQSIEYNYDTALQTSLDVLGSWPAQGHRKWGHEA